MTVEIVRTPHVIPPGESEGTQRWGTTLVKTVALTTDGSGRARVAVEPPTDGLGSTYGVRAYTAGNGATATTRVTVPTAPIALAIEPDSAVVDLGQAAGFTVRGFSTSDGAPVPGLDVRVQLTHGGSVAGQVVRLDEHGRARVVFRSPSAGTNLAIAQASAGGKTATDAASVVVAPGVVSGRSGASSPDVSLVLDKAAYRSGDRIGVSASLPGATGDALVTLEGARTYQARVVPVGGGRASASLDLGDAVGDVRVGVAFVRDGAIVTATAPVPIDGAGHAHALGISLDKPAYAADGVAHVAVREADAREQGTIVARLTEGSPSGPADFDDIGDVLRTGGTTSQNTAAESPAWHAGVAPARSKAGDIFAADRPTQVRSETIPAIGARRSAGIVLARRARVRARPRRRAAARPRQLRAVRAGDLRRRRRGGGPRDGDRPVMSLLDMSAPPAETATVMLLDTYGLVYRAFFALPVLTTTKGVPINAAYGFTMMLKMLWPTRSRPTSSRRSTRACRRSASRCIAQYKAQRRDARRSALQFALVRRMLAVYRIPIVEVEGEEADDVIATLARQPEEAASERTS